MKTKITKEMVSSLGYQRAYRRAYRKGKRDAIKDRVVCCEIHLEPMESYCIDGLGMVSNITKTGKIVIFLEKPKII